MKSNIEAARKFVKHTAESVAVETFSPEKLEHLRNHVRDRLVQEFCLTPDEVDNLLDDEYARAIAEVMSLGDPLGLAHAMKLQETQDCILHFMEMMDHLRAICSYRPIIFKTVEEAMALREQTLSPQMKALLQLMQEAMPMMKELHTSNRPLMRRWVQFLREYHLPR